MHAMRGCHHPSMVQLPAMTVPEEEGEGDVRPERPCQRTPVHAATARGPHRYPWHAIPGPARRRTAGMNSTSEGTQVSGAPVGPSSLCAAGPLEGFGAFG